MPLIVTEEVNKESPLTVTPELIMAPKGIDRTPELLMDRVVVLVVPFQLQMSSLPNPRVPYVMMLSACPPDTFQPKLNPF